MEEKKMRRGKFFTKAKKTATVILTAALTLGVVPMQNTKAQDNSAYVISQGRMAFASSSVSNSDPAYAFDSSKATRWESSWDNKEEWIYVDLGKVTDFTEV